MDPSRNPFPGVNPFVEWEGFWRDFHTTIIVCIREQLLQRLPRNYDARVEEDALLIDPDRGESRRTPDVSVIDVAGSGTGFATQRAVAVLEPSAEIEPAPQQSDPPKHRWIEVVGVDGRLITSLEILSPTNKTGDGWSKFGTKRRELFDAGVNLVDIDLLLGGHHQPFKQPLPTGEFFGFISRQRKAPKVEVFAMSLRDPLRPIPVPLRDPDPDVVLDLQESYQLAFTRGGYPRRLRYGSLPSDASPETAAFVTQSLVR